MSVQSELDTLRRYIREQVEGIEAKAIEQNVALTYYCPLTERSTTFYPTQETMANTFGYNTVEDFLDDFGGHYNTPNWFSSSEFC